MFHAQMKISIHTLSDSRTGRACLRLSVGESWRGSVLSAVSSEALRQAGEMRSEAEKHFLSISQHQGIKIQVWPDYWLLQTMSKIFKNILLFNYLQSFVLNSCLMK